MGYVFAAILIVVGGILFFLGKKKGKLKQKIEKTPTTPIDDLKEGQHAEIKGVTTCDQPLQAPASDTKCVYYSYQVRRHERDRRLH